MTADRKAIAAAYARGDNTSDIAAEHKISRQRVEQIARAEGLPHRCPARSRRQGNDRPTGEQLYQELCDAAAAAGVGVRDYAAALYPAGDANWKLEQLRIARRPLNRTIERVRALIRGDEVPPPAHASPGQFDRRYQQFTRTEIEAMGLPPSARAMRDLEALEMQRNRRERTELLRTLTERAHNDRRPGQTIADRVHELRRELAA